MSTPNPAELLVERDSGRDALTGDPLAGALHSLGPCVWAPAGTSESERDTGDQVTSRRDVYPATSTPDVRSTDRVRFPDDSTPWRVVGDVESWVSPWGSAVGGSKFQVERVTG